MAEALAEAVKGRRQDQPESQRRRIIVRDGKIIGRGHHLWERVNHAEVEALRQAGNQARGATIYVTLEPCSHIGRTSPCSNALIEAGIARVVAAMQDPNPLVSGRGLKGCAMLV